MDRAKRAASMAALLMLVWGAGARAAPVADPWIASWTASPAAPSAPTSARPGAAPAALDNQTVRQVVRLSLGGERVRVRLSNLFGDRPMAVGAAHVALVGPDGALVPGSDRALSFAGQRSAVLAPHAPLLSDPVALSAPALSSLAVSLYFPEPTPLDTIHPVGQQTARISGSGDATAAFAIAGGTITTARVALEAVEVAAPPAAKAFVALGDSITDGTASTLDANHRWPDRLAERLARRGGTPIAVLNQGISGNRVLHDLTGPNLLSRFDRDVLAQPRLAFVLVMAGINDFGLPVVLDRPDEAVSAEQVIAGYRQLIARAHARGIRIYGGVLTPFRGAGYFTEAGEAKRQAVNRWIRTGGGFDAVVDFDAALRDPSSPGRLNPAFDSGDHLHPNDAGYAAMAQAVDLNLLR